MEEKKQEKLTNANFYFFKSRVMFYLKKFKLDGYWSVKIVQTEKSDGALGGYCKSEFWNGTAEIGLIMENYPAMKDNINDDIDETARHEVSHLILGKLQSLARNRYVTAREMDDAIEETNRKITDITEQEEIIDYNCAKERFITQA